MVEDKYVKALDHVDVFTVASPSLPSSTQEAEPASLPPALAQDARKDSEGAGNPVDDDHTVILEVFRTIPSPGSPYISPFLVPAIAYERNGVPLKVKLQEAKPANWSSSPAVDARKDSDTAGNPVNDGHTPIRTITAVPAVGDGPGQSSSLGREMRIYPVGRHAITSVWGMGTTGLAFKIMDLLDSMNVNMTSLNANRKGYSDDPSPPVVVLIGVVPESLPASDKITVINKCRELLDSYNLTDVKVEIREEVIRGL